MVGEIKTLKNGCKIKIVHEDLIHDTKKWIGRVHFYKENDKNKELITMHKQDYIKIIREI